MAPTGATIEVATQYTRYSFVLVSDSGQTMSGFSFAHLSSTEHAHYLDAMLSARPGGNSGFKPQCCMLAEYTQNRIPTQRFDHEYATFSYLLSRYLVEIPRSPTYP